jgi:hypothetical protein
MKKLYTYTVNKTEKVEKRTKQKDGSFILTYEDKVEPIKIAIKKPDRLETDEYQLVYDAEFSKAIVAGVATKDMMRKAYLNAEGLEAQVDIEYLDNVFRDLQKNQNLYQKMIIDGVEGKEIEDLEAKIKDLTQKAMEYKEREEAFFSRTAESRAKKKTIFWCALNLLFYQREVDGKEVFDPVFQGSNSESKKTCYYNILEDSDDSIEERIFEKGYLLIQNWISGNTSVEDFEMFEKIIDEHVAAKPTAS